MILRIIAKDINQFLLVNENEKVIDWSTETWQWNEQTGHLDEKQMLGTWLKFCVYYSDDLTEKERERRFELYENSVIER